MGCSHSRELDTNAAGLQRGYELKKEDADAAAAFFGRSTGIASRVVLTLSCQNLRNMDKMSKSDPFVVIYMKTEVDPAWQEIDRTEIVANNQNPKFVSQFRTEYIFEEVQRVRLEVYDADTSFLNSQARSLVLGKQDYQGMAELTLAQVVGAPGGVYTTNLIHPKHGESGSTISVRSEEVAHQHDLISLKFRAEKVDKKDRLAASDPYLKISRMGETGEHVPVFKTEVKKNTLNPVWDQFQATVQQLSNGDITRPLLVECFDYDFGSAHDLIGTCQISVMELLNRQVNGHGQPVGIPLINPKKREKHGPSYQNSGLLMCDFCSITERPSFLDYIAGGTEVSFVVAIDYTASNGNPMSPESLHFLDPAGQRLTPYAQSILGVGSVLEFYDTDKQFPVYGFGGRLAPGQAPNHCFATNGDDSAPEVTGIRGVLDTYHDSLRRVQLSGPTLFQGVIKQAAAIARMSQTSDPSRQKYYVLCIITDGVINDMDATVHELVEASELPLSVVIVGVGNADFAQMEALDGDGQKLQSSITGRVGARDTVQFVPMRQFAGQGVGAQFALAKHVLAEIPGQFLAYMQAHNIPPPPRRHAKVPSGCAPATPIMTVPGFPQ